MYIFKHCCLIKKLRVMLEIQNFISQKIKSNANYMNALLSNRLFEDNVYHNHTKEYSKND